MAQNVQNNLPSEPAYTIYDWNTAGIMQEFYVKLEDYLENARHKLSNY